jgi:DNA-binding response OmpR family regulator
MGGSLSLESSPNKGSTFTLVLPLEVSVIQKNEMITTPKPDGFLKITVTDDDPAILRLIEEISAQYPIEIHSFDKVESALLHLKKSTCDLVITDIEMPSKSGVDFLQSIRENPVYGHQNKPVIAITGRPESERNSFVEMGFDAVINKPFLPEQFLETIQRFGNIGYDENKREYISSKPENGLNLKSLYEMLHHDPDAIKRVTDAFIKSTGENLVLLKKNKAENNFDEIKKIAHRMLPMFRQFGAQKVIAILEKLEQAETAQLSDDELTVLENECSRITKELLTTIQL